MLLLTAVLMLGFVHPGSLSRIVQAKPAFMDRYNDDPNAKAQWKDKCTLCHIAKGGAQRNDFGDAFEDGGYRITPKLRKKFPEYFDKQKP
jgi:cytochrome c